MVFFMSYQEKIPIRLRHSCGTEQCKNIPKTSKQHHGRRQGYAYKRRNAGLSGGNNSAADREQMEDTYHKILIIRNLMGRPWRFSELKKDLDGISQKVLTDSLRSMEEDGIVTRTVYPEVPPRVEYALSELGESMRPIIKAMEIWGTEYKEKYAKKTK